MRIGMLVFVAMVAAACDEPAPAAPPTSTAPSCPAATIDVAPGAGLPSAALIEPRVREVVTRDFDPAACPTRIVVGRETTLVEATHEGETIRASLASSLGSPTETMTSHVAGHRLLHTLLDGGVESALSNGRGVVLGFADHTTVCRRASATDVQCVRADAVLALALESVGEPDVGRLVVRTTSSASAGSEWEVSVAEGTMTTRTAPLQPGRALGTPPPAMDRFTRVRSASATASTVAGDTAGVAIAQAMPPGAATVRLDSRAVGDAHVYMLSRCEGMLARCVTLIATRVGASVRFSPSVGADAARIDDATDASTLAPGAIALRLLEEGFHARSAAVLIVTASGGALGTSRIELGHETERGETEMITEGCYRALTIEGAGRVRLAGARGWSGSHTDARGWNVVASTTCAPDAALCLATAGGFAPCD